MSNGMRRLKRRIRAAWLALRGRAAIPCLACGEPMEPAEHYYFYETRRYYRCPSEGCRPLRAAVMLMEPAANAEAREEELRQLRKYRDAVEGALA